MVAVLTLCSQTGETSLTAESVLPLPVIPVSSAGGSISHLQLMAYFQRLVFSAQHRVMVLPSPKAMATELSASVEDVFTALSVLSDMGYHCEVSSNDDPVLLADYLATA